MKTCPSCTEACDQLKSVVLLRKRVDWDGVPPPICAAVLSAVGVQA